MTGLLRDLIGLALVIGGIATVAFAAFAWDWRAGTAFVGVASAATGVALGFRGGE